MILKASITTAADDIHKYFFSEKIRLDISCESSARHKIHMKLQALYSSKNKSKTIKMSSAAIFVWRFKGKCLSSWHTIMEGDAFGLVVAWSSQMFKLYRLYKTDRKFENYSIQLFDVVV